MLLTAAESAIDVWLTFHAEIDDAEINSTFRELLSIEERRRERYLHSAADRRRYVIARAMTRTVLSRYMALSPTQWQDPLSQFGRPEVARIRGGAAGLQFSISHTTGLIALGVTRHRHLGIDVEAVRGWKLPISIADHFFAPEELQELRGLEGDRQQERLLEYWTLKEAYIKASSVAGASSAKLFSFDYPDERTVRLVAQPALADDAARWSFWQFRPTAEHLLAICAQRNSERSKLTVRKIVPTRLEEVLEVAPLRSSQL
jgi:4'-phosphopantetheinyl transferase